MVCTDVGGRIAHHLYKMCVQFLVSRIDLLPGHLKILPCCGTFIKFQGVLKDGILLACLDILDDIRHDFLVITVVVRTSLQ